MTESVGTYLFYEFYRVILFTNVFFHVAAKLGDCTFIEL